MSKSLLQKTFVSFFKKRAIMPPDLRKMRGTVTARPAPRNHFFGAGDPSTRTWK
jgi:hypothetical protein